ncbi:MAG: sugar transferase [Planctomycetota bacterium]
MARDVPQPSMSNDTQHPGIDSLWGVVQRIAAAGALAALSPALGVIAIAIKLESKGPVVFRQKRPGQGGRTIEALKFRSMRVGSEAKTKLGVAVGDPRITKVGRFLRATKLDELPQLWNIVRGDMRFVGPRPIPFALDEELRNKIPGFEQRYAVEPGLTSLAQVCVVDNGLDDRLVEDWSLRFEAERRYIRNRCVVYDLIVIGLTSLYVARKVVAR